MNVASAITKANGALPFRRGYTSKASFLPRRTEEVCWVIAEDHNGVDLIRLRADFDFKGRQPSSLRIGPVHRGRRVNKPGDLANALRPRAAGSDRKSFVDADVVPERAVVTGKYLFTGLACCNP